MRRWIWLLVILILIALGAYGFLELNGQKESPGYRLGKIDRGAIQMVISSTGRVQPVMTVEIGSQVSGQIAEVLVDFNSRVKADAVIARIDPAPFEARLKVAQADVAFARANVAMQKAALEELQAELYGSRAALAELAEDLERQRSLFARKVVPESTVDRAVALHDQAYARVDGIRAGLKKQKAQVQTALAQVESRQGKLLETELELGHTLIRSPVDGVVINRAADVGQTVAASLQAPVLFTLAQDLSDIHLEVSVDEADIGGITEGQKARFTVDAYPDRVFRGEVVQVRKQPVEVSGVVTYVIIVGTRNNDQSLLPGMTASIEIIVGQKHDVLRVPSAALRFTPVGAKRETSRSSGSGGGRERMRAMVKALRKRLGLSDEQVTSVKSIYAEMGQSIGGLRESGVSGDEFREAIRQLRFQAARRVEELLDTEQKKQYRLMRVEAKSAGYRRATTWTLDASGQPVANPVTAGISDGTHTQIVDGQIAEGDSVIVGLATGSP
jgi:HlyD family secretion protein